MNILMITHQLPTAEYPGTMAPVARQIESLQQLGLNIRVLELIGSRKLKYFPALRKLPAMLDDIDLVHAHFGYCGWIARTQFKKPIVISFMGDDLLGTRDTNGSIKSLSKVPAFVNKRLARFVDGVIVKTAEMAAVLAPLNPYIVPNGVDTDLFRPIPRDVAKQKLGWDMNTHYILFPGNPDIPVKGFPLAQEAMKQASALTEAPLELVALRNISPQDVPLYMNACSAMLMVSHAEGSPNVVKEAMSCNLALISVPVGDTVQQLEGVNGYKLVERRPEAIAHALIATLSEGTTPQGREALLKRGLDLTSVARRIEAIYQETLYAKQR